MRHWLRFQWLIYLGCDNWNVTPREALSGVSLRRWRSSRPGLSDSPGLTHRIRHCLDEQSACSPTQTPKHNKDTHTNSHVNTPSCLLHLHCSMNSWTHTRAHITHLCQGPHTLKRTHKSHAVAQWGVFTLWRRHSDRCLHSRRRLAHLIGTVSRLFSYGSILISVKLPRSPGAALKQCSSDP